MVILFGSKFSAHHMIHPVTSSYLSTTYMSACSYNSHPHLKGCCIKVGERHIKEIILNSVEH